MERVKDQVIGKWRKGNGDGDGEKMGICLYGLDPLMTVYTVMLFWL